MDKRVIETRAPRAMERIEACECGMAPVFRIEFDERKYRYMCNACAAPVIAAFRESVRRDRSTEPTRG